MKKVVSALAILAFLFSMNVNAQEKQPKKKESAKTEKACSASEKKECSMSKKGGCCAGKKTEEKK